jgi:hypothetical protein
VGSNPTPGTYIIHTSNARDLRFRLLVVFALWQPEPDFEVLFLRQPLHGTHRPSEDRALILRVAVSEHGSEVGGMVTEQPEGRQGVGRVRLSPDAPELLPDLSLLPLELVDHLLHEQRVDARRDGPKLCMLFFLHAGKPRLQVGANLEGLLAVPSQQFLLVPLQRA